MASLLAASQVFSSTSIVFEDPWAEGLDFAILNSALERVDDVVVSDTRSYLSVSPSDS